VTPIGETFLLCVFVRDFLAFIVHDPHSTNSRENDSVDLFLLPGVSVFRNACHGFDLVYADLRSSGCNPDERDRRTKEQNKKYRQSRSHLFSFRVDLVLGEAILDDMFGAG